MATAMKLSELIEYRKEIEKGYKDEIMHVTADRLIFDSEKGTFIGNVKMTDEAERQFINSRLGIPYKFFRTLSPDLQQDIFNEKTENIDTDYLVRQKGDRVRAVLTDHYGIRDHSHVLSLIYQEAGEMFVRAVLGGDNMMSVRLTYDQGDLSGGINMINGEIGNSGTRIHPVIYRTVCTNGLIIPEVDHGMKIEHLKWYSEDRFVGNIKLVIQKANDSLVLMQETKKKEIIDVEAEIISINRKLDFPDRFAEDIKKAYEIEPMATGFGIINAITRAAHTIEDVDRRIAVEAAAGKLLKVYNKN